VPLAALRVATYRFRATFGRRWGGYVALVVLIGLVGGLWWNLFAHELSVVPSPTVPVLAVVAIAVGAIVIGNVVAAVPARMASTTPTALLLRAE
jgi:hypothetical protein